MTQKAWVGVSLISICVMSRGEADLAYLLCMCTFSVVTVDLSCSVLVSSFLAYSQINIAYSINLLLPIAHPPLVSCKQDVVNKLRAQVIIVNVFWNEYVSLPLPSFHSHLDDLHLYGLIKILNLIPQYTFWSL
jgi:hypothetical protein